MAARDLPSPELLRQLLLYEPLTGLLFWRERDETHLPDAEVRKRWNSRWAGKEAFTAGEGTLYHHGKIFGKVYKAHRVIWALVYGEWPEHEVDHRDTIRTNNKLKNLRAATHQQNGCNKTTKRRFKGVTRLLGRGKFRARITPRYVGEVFLGSFESEEDAARAYDAAALKHFGEFARLNFPHGAEE